MSDEIVVTVQGRGRVNLGKLAKHDRYIARVEPDGTIIMEPAAIRPLRTHRAIGGDTPVATPTPNATVQQYPTRSAEEIVEVMSRALPPTIDDVTTLADGRRIDSRERAIAWLEEIALERENRVESID